MKFSKKAMGIAPSLTLGIDTLSKEMKAQGMDVVSFGVGEPDFDTPDYIKEAAKAAIDRGCTKYTPVPGVMDLRKAIAKRYQQVYGLEYEATGVVVSNGAKQSLFNVFQAILDPGDEVLIISPYWVTYPELVKMANGVPVIVEAKEEDDFQPNIQALEAAITPNTRAIIINNPSNPCGNVYSKEVLTDIAELAKKYDLVIVADEIYDVLSYQKKIVSIAAISEDAKQRTVIINGMSKAYAMTGWRMGYTLSDPALAKVMSSYQSHSTSNPSSVSQYAALAALEGPQDDMDDMIKVFEKRAELIYTLLNDIPGVVCRMPAGAFYVLPNVKSAIGKSYKGTKIENTIQFAELLLKEKLVAVVPGEAFGAMGYMRLSYATSEENIRKGVGRLKEFFAELN